MAANTPDELTSGIGAVARWRASPWTPCGSGSAAITRWSRAARRRTAVITPRGCGPSDAYPPLGGGRTLAPLPDEALRERLQAQAGLHAAAPHQVADAEQNIRLLVYGDFLPFSLDKEIEKMFPINIIGGRSVFGDFERDVLALEPDILVAESPALRPKAARFGAAVRGKAGGGFVADQDSPAHLFPVAGHCCGIIRTARPA